MDGGGFVPLSSRLAALGVMVLAGCAGGLLEKRSVLPAGLAAALGYALPWAQRFVTDSMGGRAWRHSEPNLLAYAMVAMAAVTLIWWGVQIATRALVNYGTVAFAMTVVWFYFSNVMDKLGRSVGLIALGVLFLAGGWGLERTRRRLVSGMVRGAA